MRHQPPWAEHLGPETVLALVAAAHEHGLKTVAHIVSPDTLRAAIDARVDIVTHTAISGEFGGLDKLVRESHAAIIPTLAMMNGVINTVGRRFLPRVIGLVVPRARMRYEKAEATVRIFRDAEKTVLAGTDANDDPTTPYQLPFGSSLHDELERLVHAGLTPTEALRAATSNTAQLFDLPDRGTIEPGRRADLLLVSGDPTTDITASRDITGVWIAGRRVR